MKIGLTYHICFLAVLASTSINSQPIYESKMNINGHWVYQDLADASIYYFEPSTIYLSKNEEGKPGLKYLKMSRSKAKTQGGLVFDNFNVLQLKLKTSKISKSTIKGLAADLNIREHGLIPIPIQKFEFNLLSGIESVRKKEVLASHLNSSYDNAGSELWTEKNITIQLSKEAAQLVDHNLKKFNELGLVFSFSYFANFGATKEEDLLKKPEKNHESKGNRIELIQFKAGQVDLDFDLERWKDSCIKELVLNEELLPRYHPIQLSCYDFSDGLRPDLLAKKIIICGAGLGNKETCTKELEFSAADPDLNAISLKFKFPILFNKPLRYRVTEIDLTGNVFRKDWVETSFEKVIDATSRKELNAHENNAITIWVNKEDFFDKGFIKSEISFQYALLGKERSKKVSVEPNKQSIIATSIYSDDNTSISYSVVWKGNNNQILKSEPFKPLKNNIIKLVP